MSEAPRPLRFGNGDALDGRAGPRMLGHAVNCGHRPVYDELVDLIAPMVHLRHRQIASDGAILVRPDRFIAWRAATESEDARGALAGALSRILARSVDLAAAAGAGAVTSQTGAE